MEIGGGSARGYLRGNSFQHRRGRVVAAALTRAKRIEKLEGIFAERKHAPKGSRFAVSWPTFLARGTGMAKGEEYFSYKLSRRNCRTTSGEQNANTTPRRERGGWCVMHGRVGAEDLVKMQNSSPLPESRSRKREAAVVPVARCCRAIVQKSWTRRVSTRIKWPIARGYGRSTGKGEESFVIAKRGIAGRQDKHR